jgi:glycosyltransferase involved in cell wall biosynthesis
MRGGAELQVENLCRELRTRGFETELVSIPFKWYPEQQLLDNALVWRLMDLTESKGMKVDLVIATKFPTYAVSHTNKVTWLIHQHRMAYDLFDALDDSPKSELRGTASREAVRKAIHALDNKTLPESRRIFAESQNVQKRLSHYNGIASDVLYHPANNAERFVFGEYGDYILSVGRLDSMKRIDLLLGALVHAPTNVKALVAGTGPESARLRSLCDQYGLADRVSFLGFVPDEDLFRLYAGAFAVFFAPFDEDYGYITLESFLSGKPVVTCSDAGGVLEFVTDGVCGIVCAPAPEALGEAIGTLYADKAKCRAFGRAGYERVKGINWDNVVNKLTATL